MDGTDRHSFRVDDFREVDAPGPQVVDRDHHRWLSSAVIVAEPDLMCIAGLPAEADPPLIADPDRPLAVPVPAQLLEMVAAAGGEVGEAPRTMQEQQLLPRLTSEVGMHVANRPTLEQQGRPLAGEAPDHALYVQRTTYSVKESGSQWGWAA